jgi:hypothetical protein
MGVKSPSQVGGHGAPLSTRIRRLREPPTQRGPDLGIDRQFGCGILYKASSSCLLVYEVIL